MKVFLNTRNDKYQGVGEWNETEGTFVVKKGSRIRSEASVKLNPMKAVEKVWADSSCVDKDGKVLKDIVFKSPSSAGQFVTKRSINGWIAWKDGEGRSLKELRNQ